jgi:hypothetical protein
MIPTLEPELCAVVELRQYTLHPGQRDTLIELFDREFVETQEAAGITVMAQFCDIDRPDRFVWLRGFAGMAERAEALAAFYGGSVWAAHRDAANATMLDSDDVLLLRPARPGGGLALAGRGRAPVGATHAPRGLVVAHVCPLRPGAGGEVADHFDSRVAPRLVSAGAEIVACYVTEPRPNTFPRLPVREGENVFVWLARFGDRQAHRSWLERLAAEPAWRDAVEPEWSRHLQGAPQVLRLAPTARSRFYA